MLISNYLVLRSLTSFFFGNWVFFQNTALPPHQGEEVPAGGEADLEEGIDDGSADKDLIDEDQNITEVIIALEPIDSSERDGKAIMDVSIIDTIDNTINDYMHDVLDDLHHDVVLLSFSFLLE